MQRASALPTFVGAVIDLPLGMAVPAEHQHTRKLLQQRKQTIAIGMPERLLPGRCIEQGNMHAQHQQALARQLRQIRLQEHELILA